VNRFMRSSGHVVMSLAATVCMFAGNAIAEMPPGTATSVGASSSVSGGEIQWHRSVRSGWQESRRSGRPMVIFITAAKCRYCDAMKQATWTDNEIRRRVAGEFVAVLLSPEENAIELSRIDVKVYPTTIVALPIGKVIDHRTGYQPPLLLQGLLNRVLITR